MRAHQHQYQHQHQHQALPQGCRSRRRVHDQATPFRCPGQPAATTAAPPAPAAGTGAARCVGSCSIHNPLSWRSQPHYRGATSTRPCPPTFHPASPPGPVTAAPPAPAPGAAPMPSCQRPPPRCTPTGGRSPHVPFRKPVTTTAAPQAPGAAGWGTPRAATALPPCCTPVSLPHIPEQPAATAAARPAPAPGAGIDAALCVRAIVSAVVLGNPAALPRRHQHQALRAAPRAAALAVHHQVGVGPLPAARVLVHVRVHLRAWQRRRQGGVVVRGPDAGRRCSSNSSSRHAQSSEWATVTATQWGSPGDPGAHEDEYCKHDNWGVGGRDGMGIGMT